ncbi:MAG: efflux RND transporter periplasmic adaptor subunit [Bacillota bacterium]|nr:efflux RND transporter periplasmic adaptor subunit [Bacillota bacterium]
MKKWIFIIIGVIVVGFIGYKWYSSKSTAQQQVSSQVRTATVQKGKMQVFVTGSGTVSPVTSEDILAPSNNNAIEEVLVSANESVKKGEDLVTFTDGSDPITAPTDGVITTISVAAGERVNAGQVVAHLTNYSNLQTVVQIDELDIPKVKVGQPVTVKISAYPDQSYTGTVSAIANEGTSTNGVSTFDVTIQLSNIQNLKVGMSTEASILTASKDNALYVPIEAVHSRGNGKFVILASSNLNQNLSQSGFGGMQMQTVETGLANDNFVEITKGLSEGQTVRLPQLAINSTTTTNGRGFMMGGFGGGGGMYRNSGYGGNRSSSGQSSNGQGGSGQSGRSGN